MCCRDLVLQQDERHECKSSSPNRRPNVNSENGAPSHNHDLSVRDILRYTQQSSSKNILRDAFRTALPMIISPQELISAQVEE